MRVAQTGLILLLFVLGSLSLAQATPPTVATPTQLDPHDPGRTLADVIMIDDRFSILFEALEQTELLVLLRRPEPLTVFAPPNDAFDLLPADELQALLADPERLREVLGLHLVDGYYLAEELRDVEQVTTLDERGLTVSGNNDIFIENALVIGEDILADNGVLHLIDRVIELEAQEGRE